MFLTGEWLQTKIAALNENAAKVTHGAVHMEEFIALPAFGGQIIVRFQAKGSLSADEIDALERQLQSLAGDEFLVDFMGSVYRQMGVDYSLLDKIIERLYRRYRDEPILNGPYAEQINEDARTLLSRCGFPDTTPVWEIQWEDDEFALLLLGQENRPLQTVQTDPIIHVQEANGSLCEGLMRAAFAARRMGVSLGRLMLDAMEE